MFLDQIVHNFGPIGILLTLIGEIGLFLFPLPGDTMLFTLGILVQSSKVTLSTVLSVSIVGSIVGGHVGYFLGKKLGKEKIKNNKFLTIDELHFQKTVKFFEKYGAFAIIFSRFVPVVRTFISPTLGIINYNKYKFITYNAIASVIWPATMIWLGIVIGKAFPDVIKYTEMIVLSAILVFIIPISYKVIYKEIHKRKRNRESLS
jgi:membrane-associated protein